MNNDLKQFSEEYLKDMQKHMALGMTLGHADVFLIRQLIDLTLAAKQAKPVCFIGKQMLIDLTEENRSCGRVWLGSRDEVDGSDRIPLYTTPQPAHTEQDGWIKCSERMPDHKVNVLAATSCGSIWTAFYNENRNCWDDGDYYDDIINVTHWMPLPAAPKPESE